MKVLIEKEPQIDYNLMTEEAVDELLESCGCNTADCWRPINERWQYDEGFFDAVKSGWNKITGKGDEEEPQQKTTKKATAKGKRTGGAKKTTTTKKTSSKGGTAKKATTKKAPAKKGVDPKKADAKKNAKGGKAAKKATRRVRSCQEKRHTSSSRAASASETSTT